MHWQKDCNGMGAPIDLENVNSLCGFELYAIIFRFIFNLLAAAERILQRGNMHFGMARN